MSIPSPAEREPIVMRVRRNRRGFASHRPASPHVVEYRQYGGWLRVAAFRDEGQARSLCAALRERGTPARVRREMQEL